ncbi:hypothetical protein GCM10028796_12930 [Ramlibacter monticola]|uniref:Uncharacterized protein n=1 Tax=Ramlibacter monticola TaxID=1926872 RepID=A0A936YTZ4_9BURK|nr:hypothetical protein [Ramlibacter monticola]MBL0390140.1 hypothetical protein [Ramlibacter monticola]
MRADAMQHGPGYRLHFPPLREFDEDCEFPCDADGRVDLDALSRRCFNQYLFARALVGRVFGAPSVQAG